MEHKGSLRHSQVPAICPYLSQINPVHAPTPNTTSRKSISLLFSRLCLGHASGLFPSGFPIQTLYATLPTRATCPAHPTLLDLITRIKFAEDYSSLRPSLCSFLLHCRVTSSLLVSNIHLSALFSNTPSLRSYLNQLQQQNKKQAY